jgi:hypothetical protein
LAGRQGNEKSRFYGTFGVYYPIFKSKNPPKVLGKVRDFYIFFDYIYTKVILHR